MGTLDVVELTDDSNDDRLLELPALVNPEMLEELDDRLEKEEV
jgi:hypothetical protein